MKSIKVKHILPNRVRFRVPAVRNNELTARRLEKCVDEFEGIHWVRVNTICAGIVVRFDPSMYTESDIVKLFMRRAARGEA